MTFWLCKKTASLEKIRQIQNLGVTIWLTKNIANHIFPKISRSKSNQILFKNYAENEVGKIVPDLLFF